MDELDKGLKDTQIKRDTQVRGSLGVPPSGKSGGESESSDQASSDRERTRGRENFDDDDRMSER